MLTGFGKLEAIAGHEGLELDRQRPKTTRLSRRPPLAPLAIAVIQIRALDDHRKVRLQSAAAFEFSKDLVVSLHKLQLHFRGEFFGLFSSDLVPPANEANHPFDHIQVCKEQRLEPNSLWGGQTASIFAPALGTGRDCDAPAFGLHGR
jgi:hypothetical protein